MPTTLDPANTSASGTLSNGNLSLTTTVSSYQSSISTTSKTSGKYVFEVTITSFGGTQAVAAGLAQSLPTSEVGIGQHEVGYGALGTGAFLANNVAAGSGTGLALPPAPKTIMVCVDFTHDDVWMWIPGGGAGWNGNNNAHPTSNPATDTLGLNSATFYNGALTTNLFGAAIFAAVSVYNNSSVTVNFGASPFVNAIPAGFQSWDPQTGAPHTRPFFAA